MMWCCHSKPVARLLLATLAFIAHPHAATTPALPAVLAPSDLRQGGVMISFNTEGAGRGNLQAGFVEAVWAFEQRKVVRDTSIGAVPPTNPPSFTAGWSLDDHGTEPNGLSTNISVYTVVQMFPPVNAMIGPFSEQVALPTGTLCHVARSILMGYSLRDDSWSNKAQNGYFFRTCAATPLETKAFLSLADSLSIKNLLVLVIDDPQYAAIYTHLRDGAPASFGLVGERLAARTTHDAVGMWLAAFKRLHGRAERWTTTLTSAKDVEFWQVLKSANFFGLGRQWLGWESTVEGVAGNLRDMVGAVGVKSVTRGPQMAAWKDWTATLQASQFPDFFKAGDNPLTDEFLQSKEVLQFEAALVDATFAVLFAMERLTAFGVPPVLCRGDALRAQLLMSDFEGIGGRVKFDSNQDLIISFDVWNVMASNTSTARDALKIAGTWNSVDGLELGGWEGNRRSSRFDLLQFVNGSSVPPPMLAIACGKGLEPASGQTSCLPCPLGTFNPVQGSLASCLPCEPGSYAATTGSIVCTVCPAGSLQKASGASSCEECSAGWFAAGVGSTACELCPQGTAAGVGSTICAECARGLYASTTGRSRCTQCPSGFTTEEAGSIWPSACGCGDGSIFVPNTTSSPRLAGATSLHEGHCFDCQDTSLRNRYTTGLWCSGGLTCEAIENRTVVESFPCADLGSACLDFEDGCRHQCIVPVAQAASLCGSARYEAICQGWSVKTSALQHGDWLPNQDAIGWQNVAILGRLTLGTSGASTTMYGTPAQGFSLIPRRPWCAPVRAGDPALRILGHPMHSVGSFPQPPLVKPGYYVVNRVTAHTSGLRLDIPIDSKVLDAQSVTMQVKAPGPWISDYAGLLPLFDGTAQPRAVPLFKCRSPEVCPGGGVGQCLPGHSGLACGQCVEQFYTNSRGQCSPCLGGNVAGWLMVFVVIAVLIVFVVLYRMTATPLAAKLSAKMSTALALGLTFNGLQTFGVISLLNIDLGEPLASILAALRIFLVDVDQLQWECVMAVNPIGKLSARLLIPPMVCGMYLAIYILSHALHRVVPSRVAPCTVAHTVNCTGTVLQVLFISICMGVIVPFKCAEHPLGNISTLVDMPQQVCGVGDHVPMSILGGVFIFLYPICAMAGCAYVIYILPQRTAEDPTFLNYCKFLVGRFRFDRFYFGILFMFRNVSIAMVPVVNPNNPLLQQVVMCTLLLIALCAQAVLWPWAANEVNWLDLSCLVSMITTVVLTAGMVDFTTVDTDSIAMMAAVTVASAFVLMFLVVVYAIVQVSVESCADKQQCTPLVKRLHGGRSAVRMDATVELLHVVTHSFNSWSKGNMATFVATLPPYDCALLDKTLTMLIGATDMDRSTCHSHSKSSKGGGRITVQRFKPTELARRVSQRMSEIQAERADEEVESLGAGSGNSCDV